MKSALILVALLASGYLCNAQLDVSTQQQAQFQLREPPAPLFILHVDGETIEVDPAVNPDMESFDPQWIRSIEIITGTDATLNYGEKGRNGVIIIDFKENYILPIHPKIKDGDGR
ncbi:MAG TPA: hypothetical protein VK666_07580 [Chryseolinea sp.]|nr:hypothetical protein [Chryseolinea sp.]